MKKKFNRRKKETNMSAVPPVAKKVPHQNERHGEIVVDNYDWMRAKGWNSVLKDSTLLQKNPDLLDQEIRAYLEAENAYQAAIYKASEPLAKAMGDEFVSRIIPNESGIPAKDGDFEYWKEYRGGDYPVHMRKHKDAATAEAFFDINKEAKGHKFFQVSDVNWSPDHKYIAYAVDTTGSENYEIRIRELATGKEFPETISYTGGSCVWSADSKTIYYTERDEEMRTRKVKSHKLGTDATQDAEIYYEADEIFSVDVSKTKSGKYILIESSASSSKTSEIRFFDASAEATTASLKVISPRRNGHEYSVQHHGDDFYFRTNREGATEYKIMKAPVKACAEKDWVDFLPARTDVTIEEVVALKNHLVCVERENALQRVVVSDYKGHEFTVEFPDQAYVIVPNTGYEYDTNKMRITYRTLANPGVTYEVDLNTGNKTVLREKKLPNGHDPSEYVVERVSVTARDGAEIPVTLLRHKSVRADGTAPLYQYGYGSYGITIDPDFDSEAISIADRGIVYAIAHIRGGADKGQAWYFDGKKLTKKNTFTDFIDVTKGLIKKGYGKEGDVLMEGRSAGGLLMGAVVNMAPELYGAVHAGVPFVDVINTMSDRTLPLTPGEWDEWGNPITNKTFYDYMKSYSPYDNIQKGVKYPLIVAPAGLTDPRVTYWEPAKWIARLRDEAKGGPFLLRMNMGSGHFGTTARFDKAREPAGDYAVCLQTLVNKGYDLSPRIDYSSKKKPAPASKKNRTSSHKKP